MTAIPTRPLPKTPQPEKARLPGRDLAQTPRVCGPKLPRRRLARAARGIATPTIVAQRGGVPVHARTVPTLIIATLASLAIAVPDHAVAAGSGNKIRSSLNVIGPQNGGGEPSVAIGPDR